MIFGVQVGRCVMVGRWGFYRMRKRIKISASPLRFSIMGAAEPREARYLRSPLHDLKSFSTASSKNLILRWTDRRLGSSSPLFP